MKKQRKTTFIALFSMLAMVLVGTTSVLSSQKGVHEVKADEAVAVSLTFPDEARNEVNNYTSTFEAVIGANKWDINGFNNNKWAWSFIRGGRKDYASTGFIKTKTAISNEITKVVVTVDSVTASNVDSTSLKIASDSTFTSDVQTISGPAIKTGEMVYTVPNPVANSFYNLEYSFKSGSGNGFIQISKIDYRYESSIPIPVLQSISVTTQPTKKNYLNGEAFDKTGMVVKAEYDIVDDEIIDNDLITVTPEVLFLGATQVTLSYEGKTTNVTGLSVTEATAGSVVYDIVAKNTLSSVGPIPTGSSAGIVETHTTSKQMTATNSQTITFTNYGNIKLTKITLSARSNQTGGAGYFKAIVDGVDNVIIADSTFNSEGWYGEWSTSYVNIVKTVDIMASSTLKFEIKASANSLYVQTYTLEWEEVEEEPLESISINKSAATIVEGEEETFSAIPYPASANNSVTWSSSNSDVASVDVNSGVVTAHVPGLAVITATSTVDVSIYGSVDITVIAAEYLAKVNSVDDLYDGAQYILANAAGTHAMANATTANYISAAAAKFPEIDDEQVLKYSDALMKIELGELAGGKYSLKTISSDEELNEKYIYAAGAKKGDNYLRLIDELAETGHWSITFDDGKLLMVADVNTETEISGTLRFNNSTKGFAAYLGSTSVDPIALYLDESSVPEDTSHDDASGFSTWIMSQPGGDVVTAECASKYGTAKTKWAALSSGAQAVFKVHEDFLSARSRLERWAIANGETLQQFYSGVSGGQQREFLDNKTTLSIVVVLSILGITTIAGFYFLKRKEKVNVE